MPCKLCQPHTPSFKLVAHPHNTSNICSPVLLTVTDFLPWVKHWTRSSLQICITTFNFHSVIFVWYISLLRTHGYIHFDACFSPFWIPHLYWYSSIRISGRDLSMEEPHQDVKILRARARRHQSALEKSLLSIYNFFFFTILSSSCTIQMSHHGAREVRKSCMGWGNK